MATWSEPFSLQGEELSYVITVTNTASEIQDEVTVNTTRYVLSEPIGERDCAEYQFTVFSKNDYSISMTSVDGWKNIPMGTVIIQIISIKMIGCLYTWIFKTHTLIFTRTKSLLD